MIFLIIFHGTFQIFIIKIFITNHSKDIRLMIEEGTVEQDLFLFKIHKDEIGHNTQNIKWKEKDEFRFNGEMYDVVRKEIFEDSVYLYCFRDAKESFLYANMDRILNRLNENDSNALRGMISLKNLLSKFYSNEINELNFACLNEKRIEFPANVFNLLDEEQNLNTPPPQS